MASPDVFSPSSTLPNTNGFEQNSAEHAKDANHTSGSSPTPADPTSAKAKLAEMERMVFGDAPAVESPFKRKKSKPAVRQQGNGKPPNPAAAAPTSSPSATAAAEPELIGDLPHFIDTYVECHDVIEAPREVHEAIAIGILGAILNDKGVTISNGALTHSMDVWQVILTGSGGGRSTSLGFAEDLLNDSDTWKGLVQKVDWASSQAMKQSFAQNPAAFYPWGEFGEKMKKLNGPQFSGMIQWWTDRYDSFSLPDKVVHRKREYEQQGDENTKLVITPDTPDIEFTFPPRSNFLASSSYEWFYKNLAQEDSLGGFLPRWMLWDINGERRSLPEPLPIRAEFKPALLRFLKKAAGIKQGSKSDISAIRDLYKDWYFAAERRFQKQPNRALSEAFWNRHKVHVLKLAVIYEFSMSCGLKVTPAAWQRAEATAKMLEENLFRMLQTGMDREGFQFSKLIEYVEEAGEDGRLWSDFSHHFFRIRTLHQDASQLDEAGKVICFTKPTKGRSAIILVHPSQADAFLKKSSEAKRVSLRQQLA